MNRLPHFHPEDFTYELPDDRIARFPLEKRDESKLLVYRSGQIRHVVFKQLDQELEDGWVLFFNNTRVIPARLLFRKPSGGVVEIFLLNPLEPSHLASQVMMEKTSCTWNCLVGGLKKWKDGLLLERSGSFDGSQFTLRAELVDRASQHVRFSWTTGTTFAEVVSLFGNTPLPPYLKRDAVEKDKQQYQTVYAQNEGAVAAPTAGLHFTPEVLEKLKQKGIAEDFVTLHVGGGTFQPIRTSNVIEHPMHAEQIIVSEENIRNLAKFEHICAVGTTSLRTLESLYWIGLELMQNRPGLEKQLLESNFLLEKLAPYRQQAPLPTRQEVMAHLLEFMQRHGLQHLTGETQLMIVPGYPFKAAKALITNFHQPDTTLMMLVAAFVGEDWRKIYQSALDEGYRFLSYGDSSLLFSGV